MNESNHLTLEIYAAKNFKDSSIPLEENHDQRCRHCMSQFTLNSNLVFCCEKCEQ